MIPTNAKVHPTISRFQPRGKSVFEKARKPGGCLLALGLDVLYCTAVGYQCILSNLQTAYCSIPKNLDHVNSIGIIFHAFLTLLLHKSLRNVQFLRILIHILNQHPVQRVFYKCFSSNVQLLRICLRNLLFTFVFLKLT